MTEHSKPNRLIRARRGSRLHLLWGVQANHSGDQAEERTTLTNRVDYPKSEPKSPLTDDEFLYKFAKLVQPELT